MAPKRTFIDLVSSDEDLTDSGIEMSDEELPVVNPKSTFRTTPVVPTATKRTKGRRPVIDSEDERDDAESVAPTLRSATITKPAFTYPTSYSFGAVNKAAQSVNEGVHKAVKKVSRAKKAIIPDSDDEEDVESQPPPDPKSDFQGRPSWTTSVFTSTLQLVISHMGLPFRMRL